ncbi:tetratricopeptide repeat protein [Spirosoma foliorum]|uniref:histidine kinase n=1 Tax=Spirosoma foliorum TaxID=2710596 RepID=A0A7G5GNA3_9BACT|nr:tetratricopeptide repeat protein [Spirosoma foliorum]QMW00345.1 tetratricopeptide repeat protein [Spirosoma foliorum]
MKPIFTLLLGVILLIKPHVVAAQQSKRDSLENLLTHTGMDTNRVILLNKAVGLYFSNNPQKAKQYAEQASRLAQQLGYSRGIGRSYLSLGVYYWSQGKYQQAIQLANKALIYFDKLNDQNGLASGYSNIGLSLRGLGDFSRATAYYFKSLRASEKAGDLGGVAKTYNNIGIVFKYQEKYDQALYYYWQSFRKSAGVDPRNQAGVLANIGVIYQLKKNNLKAITYLNQARNRFAALNEPMGLVICDNDLGETYCRIKQYDRAETTVQQALQAATHLNYTPGIISSLLSLGEIRLQTSRAYESFVFFNKALPLVETLKQQAGRLRVYKGLATAHAQTGEYARAFQFQSKWVALKDSAFNEESIKKIAGVQAEYQSEKKQAEIELLKKDQQVAGLWRNTVGAGLLAALIIAGLVVSRQRLKIRNDQVLLTQGKVVAKKNQQLEAQAQLLESQAVVLTTQAQQLQELDEAKNRFFTNVTHEFRTPLTLILGTLSEKLHGLVDNAETNIRRAEVTVMYRNAERLLQLINQLLDLSKLESGRLHLHQQTDDVKPLLNLVTSLFSSSAEQRNIRLSVKLSPERLLVSHDADQLEKVVTNLLSNAFKFTPNGGEIMVQAELIQVDGYAFVQIIVEDNGFGIAPEQADRVFERFYQGEASRMDWQPGTGVGLSLVKEIVELHKGTIRIDSQPGAGARFVVLLPVAGSDTAGTSLSIHRPAPASRFVLATVPHPLPSAAPLVKGRTDQPLLLIVEDNGDVRTFIRNLMQGTYRVVESENGRQGLKMAQEQLPNLIISDWMMPDMDGIELCHRIKTDERTSHIPFVLLTALSTQDKRLTGLQTGADDYLTKPFDARELLIRSRNLIDTRRQLHERFKREIRIQPKEVTATSADEKFLARVIAIVEANLGNADFSAEQFGQEVGLSRMQLHRKLLGLTGVAASDFIRLMRLKRAAQLLEGQTGRVSEIAYGVGFNSLSYFAKCFREQFGMLPTDYQNKARTPA